jgi:hypothetical protein
MTASVADFQTALIGELDRRTFGRLGDRERNPPAD